jgi:hypothetical protein
VKESPSRFAGIAAVILLGLGLLITGKLGLGLSVLGLGVLVLAVTVSPTAAGKAIFVAITALICSGVFAYHAASNEITGKATYQPRIRGSFVTVTRHDSPSRFREITNIRWATSALCLGVSVISFIFYRKLDDCSADYS